MNMNFANAVSAYGKNLGDTSGLEARNNAFGGSSFADNLQSFIGNSVDNLKGAEAKAMSGLTGAADLTDVVTAIGKAELTLQSIVAVRDKVISGYQEIMRMPV